MQFQLLMAFLSRLDLKSRNSLSHQLSHSLILSNSTTMVSTHLMSAFIVIRFLKQVYRYYNLLQTFQMLHLPVQEVMLYQ